MRSELVLGVDPGGTTGVVVMEPRTQAVLEYDELALSGDDTSWADWFRRVVPSVGTVAAERYLITTRTTRLTRQYDALDVLGALRYLCAIELVHLTLQSPADAKAAFADAKLKRLGVWDSVRGGHARDALRHALLASRRFYGSV